MDLRALKAETYRELGHSDHFGRRCRGSIGHNLSLGTTKSLLPEELDDILQQAQLADFVASLPWHSNSSRCQRRSPKWWTETACCDRSCSGAGNAPYFSLTRLLRLWTVNLNAKFRWHCLERRTQKCKVMAIVMFYPLRLQRQ
jgi:hypothetical protein